MPPMIATPLAVSSDTEQELDQEFELDIRISTQVNHPHSGPNFSPTTQEYTGCFSCFGCTNSCNSCGGTCTECTCNHPLC